MSRRKDHEDDMAVPPGEFLLEQMDYLGMSVDEVAAELQMSAKMVNALLEGRAPIKNDIAQKLEDLFEITAQRWLNLEGNYREALARLHRPR